MLLSAHREVVHRRSHWIAGVDVRGKWTSLHVVRCFAGGGGVRFYCSVRRRIFVEWLLVVLFYFVLSVYLSVSFSFFFFCMFLFVRGCKEGALEVLELWRR